MPLIRVISPPLDSAAELLSFSSWADIFHYFLSMAALTDIANCFDVAETSVDV